MNGVACADKTTDPESYQAWLVDLDGTLYYAWPVRVVMTVQLALGGWRAIRIIRQFRREQERLRTATFGTGDGNPFDNQVRRTAASLGIDAERVRATIEAWMFEAPCTWIRRFRRRPLISAIQRFRSGGGKVALVSDYPARHKLQAMGVADLFDVVVASGEPDGPSQLKPHPEGLLTAVQRLGVNAADCLVIGDRTDVDLAAANRAGLDYLPANSWR